MSGDFFLSLSKEGLKFRACQFLCLELVPGVCTVVRKNDENVLTALGGSHGQSHSQS